MDKTITYPGAVPLDTDILQPQRNVEYALGRILAMTLGSTTVIDGLTVTQQSSPNMTVQVGAGSIATLTTVDPTGVAYGSLAVDTANLMKLGINNSPVNMTALVAPATSGQSQNWLVEAQFLEQDTSPVVLPYYDAATPSLPYTGPANAGTSQNTRRTGTVQLQWKAGTAGATGQQNTPTPDAGWVGVAIVTLANGQSSITNSSITPYAGAPYVPTKLSAQRKRMMADLNLYISPYGSDTANSGLSAASPFLTKQKAWNTLLSGYDLNGFNVTINIANGTYTDALAAAGSPPGLGSGNTITFLGNTGTPSSVVVSVSNANAFAASNGAVFTVTGVSLAATGATPLGNALFAIQQGQINFSNVVFGACGASHLFANQTGQVNATGPYTIAGNAVTHIQGGGYSGVITVNGAGTITLTGTPTFSTAFCACSYLSSVAIYGVTFSGSASGARYNVQANGLINTQSGGASYLPGSTTGSTATGGQYV